MEQFNGCLMVVCLGMGLSIVAGGFYLTLLARSINGLSSAKWHAEQEAIRLRKDVYKIQTMLAGETALRRNAEAERDVSHMKYCKTAKDLDSSISDVQDWKQSAAVCSGLLDKARADLKDAQQQLKDVTSHRDHMLNQMQSWLARNTSPPEGEEARERAERLLRLSCAAPQ